MTNRETTSAKIRTLAQTGLTRKAIADHLGISYQHVRKVMIDAGMTGGLSRGNRSKQVMVSNQPVPKPSSFPCQLLLDAGFRQIGEWNRRGGTTIGLDTKAPTDSGVYAFVVDGMVVYVGLTQNGFKARFDGYGRGHEKQRTNARVNALIRQTIADGKKVLILISTPDPLEWNGLPVNTAAGLESGLIRMIRPAWNISGAT